MPGRSPWWRVLGAAVAAGLLSPVAGQQPATRSFERPALLLQNAHAEAVQVVGFRPDSRVLASGSADLTIKLWEPGTGAMLRTLAGHSQRVRALAFSPDGRRLFSAADDHLLIVWDPSSGALRASTTSALAVTHVAVSPDGTRLAAAGRDSTALFEIRQDTLIAGPILPGASGALAWSANGRWLASAGDGGKVWEAGAARLLHRLGSRARCLAFRPDGNLVLAGDELSVVEPESGRFLERHPIASGERCSVSPDGSWLSGLASDYRIRLWRLNPVRELEPLAGHGGRFGWVLDLAFAPDGRTLASAGDDRSIRLWDHSSGRLVRSLASYADPVESLAFHPGGKLLATGGLGPSGDVQVWQLPSGAPGRRIRGRARPVSPPAATAREQEAARSIEDLAKRVSSMSATITGVSTTWEGGRGPGGPVLERIMAGLESNLRPLAFSPDGSSLASGSLFRFLDLWDPAKGERLRTLTAHLGQVRAVVFSPDGRTLATAGEDLSIKIWDAATFYTLREFRGAHKGKVRALAFSPDASLLASAAYNDDAVKVWSVDRGGPGEGAAGPRFTLPVTGSTFSMTFGRDGQSLVVCGRQVGVWDTRTGRPVEHPAPIEDRQGGVVACAISPDESVLALGDSRGEIRLMDFRSGGLLHTLSAHNGPIWSLCFAPGGAVLVSSSADSRMAFWDAASGRHLATAVSLQNGEDWLVAAPDGLFDGTPGGWQLLRWRFSEELLDTAPAEAFFSEFFHPGLLADLMAGRRPAAPREIGRLDRRPVEVSILPPAGPAAASTREIELQIHAAQAAPSPNSPQGSGARDVRLFRNGSLVAAWRGDVLRGGGGVTLRARVRLVAGENRFTAYAFNRDNVRGPIAELAISGAPAPNRKGTLYLLAIGINRYANPDYDLAYAVADAQAFTARMAAQQQALAQYQSVKTITLFDREATRTNIMAAFARLAGRPLPATRPASALPASLAALSAVQPEDAVFVFYAGHGTAALRSFYLIPHDLGYSGSRESIGGAEARAMLARSISDRDLEEAFEGIDAARLVLIIDACNSGQVLESEEARRGPMNSRGLAQLAYEKGMYVLTAAQGYQAALEASQLGHGLLTFALVEDGLESAGADFAPRDGKILLREWLDFASLRVPEMQQSLMQEARKAGRSLAFVDGDAQLTRIEDRSLQRPRVFYRREAETTPFIVARPPLRSP